MTLYTPSVARLRAVAERHGLALSDDELEFLRTLGAGVLRGCERIDASGAGARLPVRHARRRGRPTTPDEDPLNAWAWRCAVTGAETGLLAGRRIVLKDIVPWQACR